jgi:phage tail sheath protein FI
MPEIKSFVHNGATVESKKAPAPMGPAGATVFGIVGTAPNLDPLIPLNKPYRISNAAQLMSLDPTGAEAGTLYPAIAAIQQVASVVCYAVVVEESSAQPAAKEYPGVVVSATDDAETGNVAVIVKDCELSQTVRDTTGWTVDTGAGIADVVSLTISNVTTVLVSGATGATAENFVPDAPLIISGFDVSNATTVTNVIGGIDPDTGRITGMQALKSTQESLTHISAPGFCQKPVHDALAALGAKIYAIPVGDGPSTNDQDAIALSESMAVTGTGYDQFYLVDPMVKIWSQAEADYVYGSPSAQALACFARVKAWESPGKGRMGVNIEGLQRHIDYNLLDKTTNGDLLNRYGVSYFARTSRGGYSLIGNRTVSGRFVSQVGLEHTIIRKLLDTTEEGMAENLTKTFMDQRVSLINDFLSGLQMEEALIGARVYLHPTLNSVDNYRNGEWHIAINYAGYSPNEHVVYHLNEDTGIVESFLESVL